MAHLSHYCMQPITQGTIELVSPRFAVRLHTPNGWLERAVPLDHRFYDSAQVIPLFFAIQEFEKMITLDLVFRTPSYFLITKESVICFIFNENCKTDLD